MVVPDEPQSVEPTDQERTVIHEVLDWMQKKLGIDPKHPVADNDWTLIVKFHAMVETSLNAALVKQFDAPELSGVISKLDTSNTATGKVAFAKALKIILPPSAVFIQKLSELRNFCVHDIHNFGFELEKHLESLSEDKRKELVKPIMKLVKDEFQKSTTLRGALYVGVMHVMMELAIHDLRCDLRAREAEIRDRLYEMHETQKQSNPTEG